MTLKRPRWCAYGLLALCLLAMRVGLGAQDSDLAIVEPGTPLAARLEAVGRVVQGQGATLSLASGFLVSACHVLTAAHVLAKPGEAVRPNTAIRFYPLRVQRGAWAEPVYGRVVAASPDFIMQAEPIGFDAGRTSNDWALIELERPIPDIEPIKLLYPTVPLAADAPLMVGGYTIEQRLPGLFAQSQCRRWVHEPGASAPHDYLIADCAVQSGMSGGPVLLAGESAAVAAGIVSERFTIGSKIMTIAVPISAFGERIIEVMRESDVCAVGAPFVRPAKTPGVRE